jgi:hypothetical protein
MLDLSVNQSKEPNSELASPAQVRGFCALFGIDF